MFFHYEARYLTGTLAGYLPLAGYVLAKILAAPVHPEDLAHGRVEHRYAR
jgi:hypothetical protein